MQTTGEGGSAGRPGHRQRPHYRQAHRSFKDTAIVGIHRNETPIPIPEGTPHKTPVPEPPVPKLVQVSLGGSDLTYVGSKKFSREQIAVGRVVGPDGRPAGVFGCKLFCSNELRSEARFGGPAQTRTAGNARISCSTHTARSAMNRSADVRAVFPSLCLCNRPRSLCLVETVLPNFARPHRWSCRLC